MLAFPPQGLPAVSLGHRGSADHAAWPDAILLLIMVRCALVRSGSRRVMKIGKVIGVIIGLLIGFVIGFILVSYWNDPGVRPAMRDASMIAR